MKNANNPNRFATRETIEQRIAVVNARRAAVKTNNETLTATHRLFHLATVEQAAAYTSKLIENGVSFTVECVTSGIHVTVPTNVLADLWPTTFVYSTPVSK